MTLEARFWSKVDKNGPLPAKRPELGRCWVWTGAINKAASDGPHVKPYGRIKVNGRVRPAHHVSYFLATGVWPQPTADHMCFNTLCVRPDHLRPATRKEQQENREGPTRTNPTGFRGVRWYARDKRWRGRVTHRGQVYDAWFGTAEEANAWAIAKRLELFTRNDLDRRAS